jgi:hypothetical protein
MVNIITNYIQDKRSVNRIFPLGILLILFLFSSVIVLFVISLRSINIEFSQRITAIRKDISFTGGRWSMNRYNTDPQLIGSYPLYIFTANGFVLDRRSPIAGYLDISDYRRLLLYSHAQTIATVTGQTRRVLSKPIIDNGKIIGVVTVSYYNPNQLLLNSIDKKLIKSSNYILSKIVISHGNIQVNNINDSLIDYGVAYSVVDSYNTVLKKTHNVNNIERVPSFIDPSYIKSTLLGLSEKIIQDRNTKNFYIVRTSSLNTINGKTVGVIVIGQSLSPAILLIKQYTVVEFIAGIFFFLFWLIFFKKSFVSGNHTKENRNPESIVFLEREGLLKINDKLIKIPYATNQFYLLQALYSQPEKHWKTNELLKIFGENISRINERKVYDAMIKINNKAFAETSMKIILNQNKTYKLNPSILKRQRKK